MNHDRQDYDYRKLQQQLHARLDQKCAQSEYDYKCTTTKNDEQVKAIKIAIPESGGYSAFGE